jgi:type I restriction enzyme R subunit
MLKIIEDDPNYDRKKATRLLRNFVGLKEHTINKKIEIIVEHFNSYVKDKIPDNNGLGHAKAMIVTRSRLHAVKYKLAIDKYLKENKYPYKALIAFSGKLTDENGLEHTESGMNGFSDKQTVSEFIKSENKFLIAAEKFQTGFDQPLLYAMYVDKVLSGIAAVQTLSRTNRVYPNKEEPLILDFANDADDIQHSFEPYYEETILSEGTDPNKLYDLQNKLESFHVYTHDDIEDFAKLYFDPKVRQDELNPILNKVVEIFKKLPEEDQEEFKGILKDYNRLYSFISQVITFNDVELEKLYAFGRMLARKLPADKKERLPLEVTDQIDLDALRIQKINEGSISIHKGDEIHSPGYDGKTGIKVVDKDLLSKIVEALNDKYGTEFGEVDKLILQRLEERVVSNEALMKSMKVNPKDKVKMTFDNVFEDELQGMVDEDFDFYKKVNDHIEIKESLTTRMFELIYRKLATLG